MKKNKKSIGFEEEIIIDDMNGFEENASAERKSKKRGKKQKQGVAFDGEGAAAAKKKNYGVFTALTIILYVISFGIIIGLSLILAIKSLGLAPYYSFWPFLGIIIIAVFALVFAIVTAVVTRKKSKRSVRNQTICVVVTFFAVTCGFGILLNVVFPDLISMATQSTLYTDDLYTNGSAQVEVNAALNRQFIRYNLLNGNYDYRLSYAELSKTNKDEYGVITSYVDVEKDGVPGVNELYAQYYSMATDSRNPANKQAYLEIINGLDGHKKELYDFIKNNWIFMDYDYAFQTDLNIRNCLALALTDRIYPTYEHLCRVGFNDARLTYLRDNNFKSMDQDGYLTFDDPLLLYVQMEGRMTIPAVVRLILDDRYTATQPVYDANGNRSGYDGCLFEGYFPEIYDAFAAEVAKGNKSWDENGTGVDDNGFIIIRDTHMVQRPMKWCVLDMDGNNMDVAKLDLSSLKIGGADISGIIGKVLSVAGGSLGELLDGGLGSVIEVAAGGAKLELHVFMDDTSQLAIAVTPMNSQYGMLGYMQMSWMNSNNLLFGVINLVSVRNNLFIYGAVGLVLVLGACMLREYVRKKKEEDEKKAAEKDETPDSEALADNTAL